MNAAQKEAEQELLAIAQSLNPNLTKAQAKWSLEYMRSRIQAGESRNKVWDEMIKETSAAAEEDKFLHAANHCNPTVN